MSRAGRRAFHLGLVLCLAGCGGGGTGGGGGGGGTFTPNFFPAPVQVDQGGAGPHSIPKATGVAMACKGLSVVVAYVDGAEGTVRANMSTDGGLTWLSPDVVVATDPDAARLAVACDGDVAHVVWMHDEALSLTAFDDAFVASTSDAGASWQPHQLNTFEASGYFSVCCAGPSAYVLFAEYPSFPSTGAQQIRLAQTHDGGSFWEPSIQLSSGGCCSLGALWCEGTHVVAAYTESGCGQGDRDVGVYVHASASSGASFVGPLRVDTTAAGADTISPSDLVLAGSGSDVHIDWTLYDSSSPGFADLRANASVSGGASWEATDSLVATGTNRSHRPAAGIGTVACLDAAGAHASWCTGGGAGDVHVASRSGGTWASSPRLNGGASGSAILTPALAGGGGHLYCVFKRVDPGFVETTRFVWSSDGGATWSPDTTVLETDNGDGPPLRLCADGLHVYVLWQDAAGGGHLLLTASHP